MRQEWAEAATIGDLLLRTASSAPERDALIFPDQRLTYARAGDGRAARGTCADRRRGAARRPRRLLHGEQPRDGRRVLRHRARGRRDRPDQHPLPVERAAVRARQRRRQSRAHQRPDRRLRRPARAAGGGARRPGDLRVRRERGRVLRARRRRLGGRARRAPDRGAHRLDRDVPLHLRHHVAAARGADQPRVAGAQLDRVRQRLPDGARRQPVGARARCSTSARSARS